MSSPLLVKISRDGKEVGTYEAQEAVRLRADGTLKGTDFYWHEGMPNWAPMTEFLASESGRKLAEEEAIRALKIQKRAEESLETDNGGYFTVIGVVFFIVGGIMLVFANGGDDGGSAIRQQVRTLQMTNGILFMILGSIIAKR